MRSGSEAWGDTPVATVVAADTMSDQDFARHMNARHGKSIGGLTEITDRMPLVKIWRKWHVMLHERDQLDQTHVHTP